MIQVDAVYFCDIPVADFKIHMAKYSEFGVSFLKSFLVAKSANPAFYIAGDSIIPADDGAASVLFPIGTIPTPLTRNALIDQLIKTHLGNSVRQFNAALIERNQSPLTQTEITRSRILDMMIRTHFLSFCVPFDSAKDDDNEANYYMEREWRVIGDVRFDLEDVWRIIIPKLYAKRLRNDVPSYAGQLTFSDD